jgi:hypothetical protein
MRPEQLVPGTRSHRELSRSRGRFRGLRRAESRPSGVTTAPVVVMILLAHASLKHQSPCGNLAQEGGRRRALGQGVGADAGVDCPTGPTVLPQRQTSGRRSESPDVILVVLVVNPFILRPPPRALCCRSSSASSCTSSSSPLRATAPCPWLWTFLRPSTTGGRGHLGHARLRDRLGGGRAPGPTAVTLQQAPGRLPVLQKAVRRLPGKVSVANLCPCLQVLSLRHTFCRRAELLTVTSVISFGNAGCPSDTS